MIEIEHILQRIGKLITLCEVQAYVVNRQEAVRSISANNDVWSPMLCET